MQNRTNAIQTMVVSGKKKGGLEEEGWMKQIDANLQKLLGSKAEHTCFRVMHHGGFKVLWHRPEDYEHACGVEVSDAAKQAWFHKTGKEPLRWMVAEEDGGEWVASDEEQR